MLLACLLTGPVAAQQVFRCGSERAVRYQQAPCEDGRLLNAADARSSAQASDAQTMVQQQSRAAAAMEKERRQRDRQPSPQAVVIGQRDSLDRPATSAPVRKKAAASKIHIVKRTKAAKADASSGSTAPPPREGAPRDR